MIEQSVDQSREEEEEEGERSEHSHLFEEKGFLSSVTVSSVTIG